MNTNLKCKDALNNHKQIPAKQSTTTYKDPNDSSNSPTTIPRLALETHHFHHHTNQSKI